MLNRKITIDKAQQRAKDLGVLDDKTLKAALKQSCRDQVKMIKQAEKIVKAEKKAKQKK